MSDKIEDVITKVYTIAHSAQEFVNKNTASHIAEFLSPHFGGEFSKEEIRGDVEDRLDALSDKIAFVYIGVILNTMMGSTENVEKFDSNVLDSVQNRLMKDDKIAAVMMNTAIEAVKDKTE